MRPTWTAWCGSIHDAVVGHLYPAQNPSSGERLAVVATGGYGRGTLAPGSDVDLLFLLPYKQTAWSESVVEAMLYVLWDLKLKVGHATRSVEECMRDAADMTIRTSLLEVAVSVRRSRRSTTTLVERFDRTWSPPPRPEFVDAKLKERDARVAKAGASRYLVEPNVKDGKGGLRDLNTLVLDRQIRLPRARAEGAGPASVSSRPRSSGCSRAARSFSGACVAICTSSPAAPRSA